MWMGRHGRRVLRCCTSRVWCDDLGRAPRPSSSCSWVGSLPPLGLALLTEVMTGPARSRAGSTGQSRSSLPCSKINTLAEYRTCRVLSVRRAQAELSPCSGGLHELRKELRGSRAALRPLAARLVLVSGDARVCPRVVTSSSPHLLLSTAASSLLGLGIGLVLGLGLLMPQRVQLEPSVVPPCTEAQP